MPRLSEVERCEHEIIFEGMQRTVVVERIVETLLAEMRQISHPEPHTLALVARQWTFTVMRQKGVPADVAADVAATVATRIRGAFQQPSHNRHVLHQPSDLPGSASELRIWPRDWRRR